VGEFRAEIEAGPLTADGDKRKLRAIFTSYSLLLARAWSHSSTKGSRQADDYPFAIH